MQNEDMNGQSNDAELEGPIDEILRQVFGEDAVMVVESVLTQTPPAAVVLNFNSMEELKIEADRLSRSISEDVQHGIEFGESTETAIENALGRLSDEDLYILHTAVIVAIQITNPIQRMVDPITEMAYQSTLRVHDDTHAEAKRRGIDDKTLHDSYSFNREERKVTVTYVPRQ